MARLKRSTKELVQEVEEATIKPVKQMVTPIRFDKVISTGSTLLDLAISGDKVRGGGIPPGILMEIYGPPSSGKTALLMEILGSCQYRGGDYHINDPEGRIDEEYVSIYGVEMDKTKYKRPDTVSGSFDHLRAWEPKPRIEGAISVYAEDSLAALSTTMELEDGDARGQRRAKEFSEGCRIVCRKIATEPWIVAATNQIRTDNKGNSTTGGWAVPFYASLRIKISQAWPKGDVEKEVTYGNKKIKQNIGIRSTCEVVKSSMSIDTRKADIFIIYNVGLDDVRGNMCWLKDVTGGTKYWAVTKEFGPLEHAIKHIEENNLEGDLRETIIDTWLEIQELFKQNRKLKVRW